MKKQDGSVPAFHFFVSCRTFPQLFNFGTVCPIIEQFLNGVAEDREISWENRPFCGRLDVARQMLY
jgi:hypothetical protein